MRWFIMLFVALIATRAKGLLPVLIVLLAGCQQGYPWWPDLDGDGWRNGASLTAHTDCDDRNPEVHQGATEICGNGIDDDCDGGDPDEGCPEPEVPVAGECPNGQRLFYFDADGDFWPSQQSVCASTPPAGYMEKREEWDCAPSDKLSYPGAPERCDLFDNDCDGAVDENAVDAKVWYADTDADTYGNKNVVAVACSVIAGYVANPGDCKDNDGSIYPGAPEFCDGVDRDCDGILNDDDASDAATWYRDADGDGFGFRYEKAQACIAPVGYVGSSDDCDDASAAIRPGASELCNGIDDDCDGKVDDADTSVADQDRWYADADHDNYGNASRSLLACVRPEFYVADATDCDDSQSSVNPLAIEVCDSVDNDCDGVVDEAGAAGEKTWYFDGDRDGYGASPSTRSCVKPAFHADNALDCDDTRGDVNPGATEVCEDSVDHDCDGTPDNGGQRTWYLDADLDTYGDKFVKTVACLQPSGYVSNSRDCDDSYELTYPGAAELCDSADNDCDGQVDEGASLSRAWYLDTDGDGYGDPSQPKVLNCAPQTGRVLNDDDCLDSNASVNPEADEVCDNGLDDDCNGSTDSADSACGGSGDPDEDGTYDVSCVRRGGTTPYIDLTVEGDVSSATTGLSGSIAWFDIWQFNLATGGATRVISETYPGDGSPFRVSVTQEFITFEVRDSGTGVSTVDLLRANMLTESVCRVARHSASGKYYIDIDF